MNQSAPAATVVPILIDADVAKSIEWLCEAFGFEERLRAEPDGSIMIGRQGGHFRAPRDGDVHQYVLVHVDEVDRHFEHAKVSGARIVEQPHNAPFGERHKPGRTLFS